MRATAVRGGLSCRFTEQAAFTEFKGLPVRTMRGPRKPRRLPTACSRKMSCNCLRPRRELRRPGQPSARHPSGSGRLDSRRHRRRQLRDGRQDGQGPKRFARRNRVVRKHRPWAPVKRHREVPATRDSRCFAALPSRRVAENRVWCRIKGRRLRAAFPFFRFENSPFSPSSPRNLLARRARLR